MKKIITDNSELLELLSNHISIECDSDMRMVMTNEDASKVDGIVRQHAPYALHDYSITDITSLEDIAYENGLEYVTTCAKGNNGYPSNLMGAIIGLENIEEARDLARIYNLDIIYLHKRDGWNMYERIDYVTEAIRPKAEWYGDDFNFYTSKDAEDYFENEVKPFFGEFDNFESLQDFINEQKEVAEELRNIDDTQIVITCQGRYYDTIDKECMKWSYDTHTFVIGLDRYEDD